MKYLGYFGKKIFVTQNIHKSSNLVTLHATNNQPNDPSHHHITKMLSLNDV